MADLVEHDAGPVAVLHAGGMDDDPQRQAFNVDQGVELATLHPLAGVITACVVFTPVFAPPFSAAFSDWLSMMAAVGLASQPVARARPQATPPKSAPTRRRAGTGGKWCRLSSAAERDRGADSARGNRCAEDRRSRSSPRACRSGAVVRLTSPEGSAAPAAPTAKPSNHSEVRLTVPLRPHAESRPFPNLETVNHNAVDDATNFWVRLLGAKRASRQVSYGQFRIEAITNSASLVALPAICPILTSTLQSWARRGPVLTLWRRARWQ